jgi:hypothetical protein
VIQFRTGGRQVSAAYRIEVYWNAEDETWIANVPELT